MPPTPTTTIAGRPVAPSLPPLEETLRGTQDEILRAIREKRQTRDLNVLHEASLTPGRKSYRSANGTKCRFQTTSLPRWRTTTAFIHVVEHQRARGPTRPGQALGQPAQQVWRRGAEAEAGGEDARIAQPHDQRVHLAPLPQASETRSGTSAQSTCPMLPGRYTVR